MNYIMSKDQKKKKKKMSKKPITLSPARKEFIANYELKQELVEQAKVENRSPAERFFDRHNHKMEFMRTFFAVLTLGLQGVILAKLFGVF